MVSTRLGVAPEKAVFRPALPLSSLPGLYGASMKLTYGEQLRHPNWQRKRLERLQSACWECQNCGGKQETLHVHHRQYFKNRMAWEYEDEELSVLCDGCHAVEHAHLDALKRYLAHANTAEVLALVGGFHSGSDEFPLADRDGERAANALAYAAGVLAGISYGLSIDQMLQVAGFAASMQRDGSAGKRLFEQRGDSFGEEAAGESYGGLNAESHPA